MAVLVIVAVGAQLLASASTAAAQQGAGGDSGTYPDTPADSYYAESVSQLTELGVFADTLCEDGFCPDEAIDRKTIAVWVVRVLDEEDPAAVSESRFSDLDVDSFYAPFVERLAELGVTRGCGDGSRFCPDDTVTRAQMAAFLSRAFDLPEGPDPGFSDVAADSWYASDVAKLAASGITKGCGPDRFCPLDDTKRAQMAAFLWRAINEVSQTTPLEEVSATGESVSVGAEHSCAVRADYAVTCWGGNDDGQSDAPPGRFLAVSAGREDSCAVRFDRTLACWGPEPGSSIARLASTFVTPSVPPGFFLSVSASAGHPFACGLRTDQTIDCWGQFPFAPTGRFRSVSAGYYHSCGVRDDQSVACWNHVRVTSEYALHAPTGRFLSVSAGKDLSCGVRANETVECWGVNGEAHVAPAGRFRSVSAGVSNACGVRVNETVECWGVNGEAHVAPAGRFLSVSAGTRDACGVRANGTVECWGLDGLIGPPSGEFLSVSGGCGLRSDQTLACWGIDSYNRFYKRIGPSGTFLSVSSATITGRGWKQCGVRTDQTLACWDWDGNEAESLPSGKFLSIDANSVARGAGACAVRVNQTVACFEFLGLYSSTPGFGGVRELYAPPGRFLSVSDGCGVRIDQTVTCWAVSGSNGDIQELYAPSGQFLSVSGECGIRADETLTCWNKFSEADFEVPLGQFLSVEEFGSEACGIRADNTITCWVYKNGQLSDTQDEVVPGRFLSAHIIRDPETRTGYRCGIRADTTLTCWGLDHVTEPPSGQFLAPTYRDGIPTLVWRAGNDDAAAAAAAKGEIVSAGLWHSCGVRADRTIACWGSNHIWASFPGKTGETEAVFGQFLAVSSGSHHSCGLRIDQSITCWGDKGPSQLSFPLVSYRESGTYSPSGAFLSVSAGGGYSCGLRIDHTIFCWVLSGALGQPPDAPAGEFLSVSAGGGHSCGVRVDQTILCWGDSDNGQADAPAGEFLSVSAGGGHSCGVRVDQTILCWGDSDNGQADAPAGEFLSVSAGGGHSCGVRVDQTILCWGSNQDRHGNHIGQAVAPPGRFLSVSAGHRHTCGLDIDRAVTCWGDNTSGWPVDEDECIRWTGGPQCNLLSYEYRPPGQSDPPSSVSWSNHVFAADEYRPPGQSDPPSSVSWSNHVFAADEYRPPGQSDPPAEEEDTSEGTSSSTNSTAIPNPPDISSLIANATYGSYPLVFLQRLRNKPDRCWIAINNYVYDVTPGDEGYNYPGPGQITDLCGQDASVHFSSNNLGYPPIRYLKGHLRSR